MKNRQNNISILFLLLIPAALMIACEDEVDPFNGPYRLNIVGPAETVPGVTNKYTIGDFQNPDSYTWSVEGPAEIVGSASDTTVTVQFSSIGDVMITVTNGTSSGTLPVAVDSVAPVLTVDLKGTEVLRSGESDTVFFTFAAPLANDPEVVLNTDTSGFAVGEEAFESGTLGDLKKVSDTEYYAIYTAGTGNGTPEAFISNVNASEAFGGLALDSLGYTYAHLYEVDNVDPAVNLSYSDELVNDTTVITITATFTEPVMAAQDSAIFISLSGGGMTVTNDTLKPTDDPLVYAYTDTVESNGDGPVTVEISNVTDLAGNALTTINNASALTIDNVAPVLVGTATDEGDNVSITLTSTKDGMGWYRVLASGDPAPATVNDFLVAENVAEGTMELEATVPGSVVLFLAPGSYDVYYLAQDEAGNYSDIVSTALTVD